MPQPTRRTIALAGRTIPYTVRPSDRARLIRFRVTPQDGLVVVVPTRGKLPDLDTLLREKATWIVNALDRMAAIKPPPVVPLVAGVTIPFLGLPHQLQIAAGPGVPPAVLHDAQARTLTAHYDPEIYQLTAILDWWFRNEARAALSARADAVAQTLGVRYQRLTVRDAQSRWGSCSSTGNLNFNWRLILAPPAVLNYVVVHELAHLRELNHSDRFWAVVAQHCPDYLLQQRWLKEHGSALLALLKESSP